ncbi:MAG: hypothetical protein QXS32_09085 [Candidatus Nezhaarchaeales archaeon]
MFAEAELISAFLKSSRVGGLCVLEFPLIPPYLVNQLPKNLKMFQVFPRVDLVCFEGGESSFESSEKLSLQELQELVMWGAGRVVWVLEAKNKLARDVIGDILFDKHVLPLCYPELATKAKFGVIVGEADKHYMEIAWRLGIEVFVVSPKHPRKLRCSEISGVFCIDLSERIPTPLHTASSIYDQVKESIRSESVKEVVDSSLPAKIMEHNTVILYWRDEPRCEVTTSYEIVACDKPCVIIIYQLIPREERNVRVLVIKNDTPITKWMKSRNG